MTKLMNAIKSNNINLVTELIKQKVDVNQLDSAGDAPVVQAAYLGYNQILKLLLQAGADVTAVDPGMKATALHAAAYAGRVEASKLLIEYKIDIDKQGPYNGYTALHDAVWQNNVEVAKVLIDAGANLTIKSQSGQTALEFAKTKKHTKIVEMIEKKN